MERVKTNFNISLSHQYPLTKSFTNSERTFLVTRCSFILRYSQDAIPITIGLSLTSSFSTTLPITSEISEVAPSVVNQTPAMRKHLNIKTVREIFFYINKACDSGLVLNDSILRQPDSENLTFFFYNVL